MVKWLDEVGNGILPAAYPVSGWAKIAFCYAFYYMKQNINYMKAMKSSLSKGGDADTNACIIGGLIGALNGPKDIP